MKDLINDYRESLKKVRAAKERVKDRTITINGVEVDVYAEEERRILSGMEDSLQFCIKWMETGRMPGSRRGAERRAAYQREFPVDPQRFPFDRFTAHDPFADDDYQIVYGVSTMINVKAEKEIDPIDDETIGLFIDDILSCLSEREREVFEMKHVGGLTQDEIADALGVSQPRVVALLESANRKLERWRNCERWGL